MRVSVRARASSLLRCALCHEELGGAVEPCAGCGTRVHAECREGRCPSLGCRIVVRIDPSKHGDPWPTTLTVVGLAIAGTLLAHLLVWWARRPIVISMGGLGVEDIATNLSTVPIRGEGHDGRLGTWTPAGMAADGTFLYRAAPDDGRRYSRDSEGRFVRCSPAAPSSAPTTRTSSR